MKRAKAKNDMIRPARKGKRVQESAESLVYLFVRLFPVLFDGVPISPEMGTTEQERAIGKTVLSYVSIALARCLNLSDREFVALIEKEGARWDSFEAQQKARAAYVRRSGHKVSKKAVNKIIASWV